VPFDSMWYRMLMDTKHYNHLANEQTAAKLAEYNAWIRSHTPEQIVAANNARSQLRIKLKGKRKAGHPAHTAKLIDDRHVKRPAGPYQCFFVERHLSGDLKGIAVTEAAKIIGAEWKALSAGEKKVCASELFTCFIADRFRNTRTQVLRTRQGMSAKRPQCSRLFYPWLFFCAVLNLYASSRRMVW
jgi:hypothetical protein